MLVKIESESERLIAGSHWILNRTVAMGMNCGTGLGAVRLKNLKSKVATLQWWRRRTATKIKTTRANPFGKPAPAPVTTRTGDSYGHVSHNRDFPYATRTN